jgi:hypothetical protein
LRAPVDRDPVARWQTKEKKPQRRVPVIDSAARPGYHQKLMFAHLVRFFFISR